jgi:hypothetical protein
MLGALVDRIVVDAGIGRDAGLVRQILAQEIDLLGREIRVHVQFAGPEALQGRGAVLGRIVVDRVDRHLGGVIELGVFDRLDVGLGDPLVEHVGAVADHVAGLDPGVAMFLDLVFGHRKGGVVGQLVQEEGGRGLERDLQGVVVDRLHAQSVHAGHLAAVDRLGVFDRIEQGGVLGAKRRVQDALEGELEVVGRDRHAVRPGGAVAHVEGVDRAVVADLPVARRARDRSVVGGFGQETQEQVADHVVFPDSGSLVGVQGAGLAAGAAMKYHFGLCRGGAERQGGAEGQGREAPAECFSSHEVHVLP